MRVNGAPKVMAPWGETLNLAPLRTLGEPPLIKSMLKQEELDRLKISNIKSGDIEYNPKLIIRDCKISTIVKNYDLYTLTAYMECIIKAMKK